MFAGEIARRGYRRCPSYLLCGVLGTVLGTVTGIMGAQAIAVTTWAIERVVLRHLAQQIGWLRESDPDATRAIEAILADEQTHHDNSVARLHDGMVQRWLGSVVAGATEAVIWIGMRR